MNLEIGTQLGHYEILGALGSGGMGEVYRARDTKLKREVALKVLPGHVANNPDTLSRFEREAVALAQLSHPNILSIHDFGRYDGVTLAVTELLDGENLRRRLERGPVPTRRALEIAALIAEGLAAAHSKGIVHRDLKPENIFLTSDGQVKILDFGLAHVEAGHSTSASPSENSLPTETDPGIVKGTIGYISPEQLRGQPVDGRSDIFSLGCVLYEMLTGKRAFARETVADTMTAILKDEPEDLLDSGRQVPPEAERVTLHCLNKNVDERFQSARDLALYLRSLVSSNDITVPPARRSRWKSLRPIVWLPALALLLLVGLLYRWPGFWETRPTATPQKPSLAVLYFENHTGDPSLEWLRPALTNMLVTDLSQSPQIEVLSTDRLYQLLKELGQLDEPTVSSDLVEQLARQAGVDTVLVGSFVKAGEAFRITTRLQEAASGRILATERVEGSGEDSIFEMVDEITRRIKDTLAISLASEDLLDRGIEEVTTSSVAAYRHYSEGNNFHYQSKEQEAVAEFERAVEVDPNFAMALAKLSVSHWNLGHVKESYDYASKALEHVDRLTARERYYIEGRYYSLRPETQDKAIEAYERAVSLYPDHSAARHNLANLYHAFERYDDAIAQFEESRRRGTTFAGTYTNLATSYAARGDFDKGLEVLKEYVEKHPDNAVGYRDLGNYYLTGNRLDEASQAFDRAEVLAPGDLEIQQGRWGVFVLQRDWKSAEEVVEKVQTSSNPYWIRAGLTLQAFLSAYRGEVQHSVELLREASESFPQPGPITAASRVQESYLLLEIGRPEEALRAAEKARKDGKGYPIEGEVLTISAVAQAQRGHPDQAEALCREWESMFRSLPQHMIDRVDNVLKGCFALAAGNPPAAVALLEQAEVALPSGLKGGEHIRVWSSLAEAYWESGRREEAAQRFLLLAQAGAERLWAPTEYVRSLYYLGKYYSEKGDRSRASEYFGRFVDYWGQGSVDPERLAEAKAYLG